MAYSNPLRRKVRRNREIVRSAPLLAREYAMRTSLLKSQQLADSSGIKLTTQIAAQGLHTVTR